MAREKDNSALILIIGAVIMVLLIQRDGGSFQLPGAVGGQTPDTIHDYATYTNVVSLVPIPICVGDNVTLTISTNIPNGHCSLFASPPGGAWQYVTTVALDGNGFYSATQVVNIPTGQYIGAAICSDAQGNAKISNSLPFDVIFCSSPAPDNPPPTPPSGQIPCAYVTSPSATLCPFDGYCAIPEQTCTFIPATLSTAARCGCEYSQLYN